MRVTFPLVSDTNGFIQYPDKVTFFSNTQILNGNVIADYTGSQSLTQYTPPPVTATANTKITRLAYLNRLGAELVQVYTLAQTNMSVQVYKDKVFAADFIDLADPQVAAGLQALKAANIYTDARISEILTTPIADLEAYKS